jgi:hypothetical protein
LPLDFLEAKKIATAITNTTATAIEMTNEEFWFID